MKIKCNYFNNNLCRSCGLLKESGFETNAAPLPKIDQALINACSKINPWQRCKNPIESRTKAKFSVTGTHSNPIIGILDENLQGVELENCLLHKKIINECTHLLTKLICKYKISIYDIARKSGELKGVIIQTNRSETQLRVRLIMRSEASRKKIELMLKELSREFSAELLASMNIQPVAHQIAEGDLEIPIFGQSFLWENYNDLAIGFGPKAFTQVTPEIAEQLYLSASEMVVELGSRKALDLFCGAGGFSLHIAKHVEQVKGVEISSDAISSALESSKRLRLENTIFCAADVSKIIEDINNYDLIICNPPRRGLGDELVAALNKSSCEHIIYSSCNYKSLLSDYEKLRENFDLAECTPFEMFPLTSHFEILALLRRK